MKKANKQALIVVRRHLDLNPDDARALYLGAGTLIIAGKPEEALPAVADRKFMEFDVDNFDDRLKAMKPRAAFRVPNTLTGDGQLSVDMTFESMDDFSPDAVARKVDSLNQLLEARNQLNNLVTYMDGKTGAEELIAQAINDPALLKSLVAAPKPTDEGEEG